MPIPKRTPLRRPRTLTRASTDRVRRIFCYESLQAYDDIGGSLIGIVGVWELQGLLGQSYMIDSDAHRMVRAQDLVQNHATACISTCD